LPCPPGVDSIPRWQLVIAYYGQPCYNFFFFFFFFFFKKKKKKIQSEKRRNGTLKIEKGNLSHYIWGKKEHEGKEWECGLMEFL
jgi:hypothetical protein